MKETKFTPGPWKSFSDGYKDHAIFSEYVNSRRRDVMVAVTSGRDYVSPEEDEANANLIAAAPLMYEALKNIENDDKHMPASAWELIQLALARAEGR